MTNEPTRRELADRAQALASALAEFEHQARRVRDQLERNGGRSILLETELEQIKKNIDLTRRDLARTRALGDAGPKDRN